MTYGEVFSALESVSEQLGRRVSPTVYTRAEWTRRIKAGNAFAARVQAQPKLWIIGGENDLRA